MVIWIYRKKFCCLEVGRESSEEIMYAAEWADGVSANQTIESLIRKIRGLKIGAGATIRLSPPYDLVLIIKKNRPESFELFQAESLLPAEIQEVKLSFPDFLHKNEPRPRFYDFGDIAWYISNKDDLYRYRWVLSNGQSYAVDTNHLSIVADMIQKLKKDNADTLAFIYLRPLTPADIDNGFGPLDEATRGQFIKLLVEQMKAA